MWEACRLVTNWLPMIYNDFYSALSQYTQFSETQMCFVFSVVILKETDMIRNELCRVYFKLWTPSVVFL
jgi:hypothetical protein